MYMERKQCHKTGCGGGVVILNIYKNPSEVYFLQNAGTQRGSRTCTHAAWTPSRLPWWTSLDVEDTRLPSTFFFECSGYDKCCLAYLEEWLKLSHHGFVIKLIYWRPWTADTPWSIYSVPREEQLPTFQFKGGLISVWLHLYMKTSFDIGRLILGREHWSPMPWLRIGLDLQGMWPLFPSQRGKEDEQERGACAHRGSLVAGQGTAGKETKRA